MKHGWQVFPEFVVTQGEKSKNALVELKSFFKCGNVYINRRSDNHKEPLCRYCVRGRHDLSSKIVPFFNDNPPRTAKADDFNKFKIIIQSMNKGEHLTIDGMNRIARIVETMNRRKPSRFLESSETIRQTPGLQDEDIVRTL